MRHFIGVFFATVMWFAFGAVAQAQSASRSYDQGVRAYRAQNYQQARDHFRSACDFAHGQACFNYGVMAARGLYGEADPEHARWLYGRSCEFGHMPGCYNFGNMLSNGEGGAKDEPAARQAFDTGCTGGLTQACSNLAIMLNTGRGGAPDQARARTLFAQACEAEDVAGCSSLGNMLLRGDGGPVDLARGRSLLQGTCDGGDRWSCERIANLDPSGRPAAPVNAETLRQGWAAFEAERYPEALNLLLGHARAGDGNAQYAIGYMHTFGVGVGARDYLQAADWLRRAAEQGNTGAQDLIVQIAPNIVQARFIDHIDRFGPDTTSLQSFSNDVYDYCALRGPNCSALLGRRNQLEREHNMRAEAANMARIWSLYGSGETDEQFWARARARSACLREVRRSIEAQTRGRQQWRYVDTCD